MKGFLIKFYTTVFFFIFTNTLNAQENKQSAFSVNYNYQFAFGNISKTFGNNSSVGACYFFETTKNYLFGIEGSYMFGNKIKDESIFDGGFLAFGVSGRRAQSTPDCFRCGVGVEFSQSETGNGECLLNVCGVCRI